MAMSNEEKILEKLEQILKVLAIQIGSDRSSGERVHLLKTAGLDNKTIAEVLNMTTDTVRALASQFRAKKKR